MNYNIIISEVRYQVLKAEGVKTLYLCFQVFLCFYNVLHDHSEAKTE